MEKEKLTPPNASGSKLSKHESLKVCLDHVDYIDDRVRAGPGNPGKSLNFRNSFSRPGKSLNFEAGPGKSWKVLEI